MLQQFYKKIINNENGFTLVELLVVIIILGILVSITTFNFSSQAEKAKDAKAEADIKIINSALELYKIDEGSYPSSTNDFENDLSILLTKKYLKKIPSPPSGYKYFYDGTAASYSKED